MVPTLLFSRMGRGIRLNGYLTFNRFRRALAELIIARGNFRKVFRDAPFSLCYRGISRGLLFLLTLFQG